MRARVVGLALMGILVTSTAWAQDRPPDLAAPPTKVCQIGAYRCPAHLEMQATWPARCPLCQAVLEQVPPSAATAVGFTAVAYANDPGEQARERERLREQTQQAEKWRERYRHYGYAYPPYVRASPPPGYRYFPSQGYYFSPNTGLYYFPSNGYFYSPRTGQYFFYNPDTGRYYPAWPGYQYYQHYGY